MDQEERRLLNSLKALIYLCDHNDKIDSPSDFLNCFQDAIQRLNVRQINTKSNYLKDKLKEIPHISEEEIDDLIAKRSKPPIYLG